MKTVVLGVSGGIAAYKACDVLRGLQKAGCDVHVVLTSAAQAFVGAVTFQSLSGHRVITDLFDLEAGGDIEHVRLAREADLLLVAPCTADVLARMARGIASDFLTTFFTATEAPTLLAPSMNVVMWHHAPVQRNLEILRSLGVHVVEPEEGRLACGETGAGRLAAVGTIVSRALEVLGVPAPDTGGPSGLAGRRVLVTAGPTAEDLDPVRTLTSRSSGRMGFAVAREARARGAEVVLVHGPASVPAPEGVERVEVRSAEEMRDAVLARLDPCDVVVAAAAVADFRPERFSPSKIKKGPEEGERALRLVRNPDVLAEVSAAPGRSGRILVGFALETEDLEEGARRKLREKDLDLVVANPASNLGAEEGEAVILDARGELAALPRSSKDAIARALLDAVEQRMRA